MFLIHISIARLRSRTTGQVIMGGLIVKIMEIYSSPSARIREG